MSEQVLRIKKENAWKYSTFLLAALLVVLLMVQYGSERGVVTQGTGVGAQVLPAVQGKAQIPVSDKDVQIGSSDASVTVVEFADFSCPWCGAASGQNTEVVTYAKAQISAQWEPPVPKMMEEYVKNGKIRFVMKYYPGHGSGQQAQLIGWCLYDQNKDSFWKYHDLVFANQADANNAAKMKTLAQQAGGNVTNIDECLKSKNYEARLAEDSALGRSLKIAGTPAFYVNNIEVLGGAVSYSTLKQAIEAALEKK